MYDISQFVFASILIGCISTVYHLVISKTFLEKWFQFGYNHFGKDQNSWKYNIYMPVWGCELCTAGQIALWSFPFMFDYAFAYHIGYVALTILVTKIISFTYNKITND